MESLFGSLPPFLNSSKITQKPPTKTLILYSNYIRIHHPKLISSNFLTTSIGETQNSDQPSKYTSRDPILYNDSPLFNSHKLLLKPHFQFPFLGFSFPLSCIASETGVIPTEEVSNKINLESILVSIDNFFTRYPFFVATVTFIWLVVIPITEQYLQKYKFISAINAFKKLQNDPTAQLLDIRDSKSIAYLGSPNLKILNKKSVQVDFREGDEEGFVKRVLEKFGDPTNTSVCIIDNFDGNSMKVAELLVKNGGFKEAYAVRGGIRGDKGWVEIQETLLPLAVHVYPKKREKMAKQLDTNGEVTRQDQDADDVSSNTISTGNSSHRNINEGLSSDSLSSILKGVQRPLSPYPNYPDFKPPSSPTPSKPK